MNIFEKLESITNELDAIAKNLTVGYGKSAYKAVGEADVLRAVKPLEAKYGVYSYPVGRKIIESGFIETQDGDVTKKRIFERIETTYRFVNIDTPDEYIDIISYGDGIDSGDKSVGKAMTYSDKYALLKAYKIVTGEDPDQYASEDLKGAKTNIAGSSTPIGLSADLIDEAKDLGIDLSRVAAYYKKKVSDLTNAELLNAIDQKKAFIAKHGEGV